MPGGMDMGGAPNFLSGQPDALAGHEHLQMLAGFGLPLTVQATILVLAAGVVTWAARVNRRTRSPVTVLMSV